MSSLHPTWEYTLPESIDELPHLIFFGPSGVGKYTQMKNIIRKYSPSQLKYEKRIIVETTKQEYMIKISDIHFEIDMSLLGCNAKQLWNELYVHMVDVILARPSKVGIVVCKCFNEIAQDLLHSFYSYMQTLPTESFKIKYILMTDSLSFIPDPIVYRCHKIRVPRPSKAHYQKISGVTIEQDISDITNAGNPNQVPFHRRKSETIFSVIVDADRHRLSTIRECIYDLLTYNMNINNSMWFILSKLIKDEHLQDVDICDTMLETYRCLKYYNNNYRPIYHLEKWVVYLINTIHGYKEGLSDITCF